MFMSDLNFSLSLCGKKCDIFSYLSLPTLSSLEFQSSSSNSVEHFQICWTKRWSVARKMEDAAICSTHNFNFKIFLILTCSSSSRPKMSLNLLRNQSSKSSISTLRQFSTSSIANRTTASFPNGEEKN